MENIESLLWRNPRFYYLGWQELSEKPQVNRNIKISSQVKTSHFSLYPPEQLHLVFRSRPDEFRAQKCVK